MTGDGGGRAFLKACLNGGRRRSQAAGVPESPADLAAEAAAAVEAGADAVHVHPRDASGRESLAPEDVAAAVDAVRAAVPGVSVGVTTGAWITRNPVERLSLVSAWTAPPDFASVNFSEPGAVDLCGVLLGRGIAVEAGIWSAADARALVASGVASRCTRVLIEPLERELEAALANAEAIEQVLDLAGLASPRLLHGHDGTAWALLGEAFRRGYQARIGMEDALTLPDGTPAAGNAALVAAARSLEASIEAERAG